MGNVCGTHHHSIFKFLEGLRKEQTDTEHAISRIEAGLEPTSRKAQYVAKDKQILAIVKKFDGDVFDGNIMPYLTSIAHHTSM